MTTLTPSDGLFYPFHLCRPRTLDLALTRYRTVHFRDYMALRLTPLMGLTAYQDRMGDGHPALVASGRVVQGYPVSGALDAEAAAAVDRDLADPDWRAQFHAAMTNDRRFQRGLFDLTHAMRIGGQIVPGPAALLRILEPTRADAPYSLAAVQRAAQPTTSLDHAYAFEYGLALVKTAAAQVYTIRLAQTHGLTLFTDSKSHWSLLDRTLRRERLSVTHDYLDASGVATSPAAS